MTQKDPVSKEKKKWRDFDGFTYELNTHNALKTGVNPI